MDIEKAKKIQRYYEYVVAIAFVVGMVAMWISRMVFTFTYRVNGKTTAYNGDMGGLTSSSLKIGIFSGIAVTSIIVSQEC